MARILVNTSYEMILDDEIHPHSSFALGFIIIAVIAAFYLYPFFISYPSVSSVQIVVLPAVFLVLGIVSLLSASWITATISKAHHRIFIQKRTLFRADTTTYGIRDLFREHDTRDELGVGSVREAFADMLGRATMDSFDRSKIT